ncbi:MAG: hypothetical protein WCE73_24810 [Candidatus Angelobacter sp.]
MGAVRAVTHMRRDQVDALGELIYARNHVGNSICREDFGQLKQKAGGMAAVAGAFTRDAF